MSERRCGDCEFWKQPVSDRALGRCFCMPAVELKGPDDGCGQFHPRAEPPGTHPVAQFVGVGAGAPIPEPPGPRFKVGQRVVHDSGELGTVVQVERAKARVCWDGDWQVGCLTEWPESELRPASEGETDA